jgi:hypothetical protein
MKGSVDFLRSEAIKSIAGDEGLPDLAYSWLETILKVELLKTIRAGLRAKLDIAMSGPIIQ